MLFPNYVDELRERIEELTAENARLTAIVDRMVEDMGTIGDKLGSVLRTIPTGERSDVFISAIDAANRIAFTAWREASEKARKQ